MLPVLQVAETGGKDNHRQGGKNMLRQDRGLARSFTTAALCEVNEGCKVRRRARWCEMRMVREKDT